MVVKTKIFEELADFYPLWRDACLGKPRSDVHETKFILSVFKSSRQKIRTVIDLGGGVGTHSKTLMRHGYDVTIFDCSAKALSNVKKNYPKIKTLQGSFETIGIEERFDAAICMWSTLSYILSEKGRRHFYKWLRHHVRYVIVLDEPNFLNYPSRLHKIYYGQNKGYSMKITRDWVFAKRLKKTKFLYKITNRSTKDVSIIKDQEIQQYLTTKQISDYLGTQWKIDKIFGEYDLKNKYDRINSSRIIAILIRR